VLLLALETNNQTTDGTHSIVYAILNKSKEVVLQIKL